METPTSKKGICTDEELLKKIKASIRNPPNPMMVAKKSKNVLIQPHNYRRYYALNKEGYNPTPTLPPQVSNHGKEHIYKNFYGCTIIIHKQMAEVINLWHSQQYHLIPSTNPTQINARIDTISKDMEEVCTKALKKLLAHTGGSSDFIPLTRRKEEIGIWGDEHIDAIPPEKIIQDTVFKKVYPDKTEFLGIANVKQYIKNRAIENLAPEIAQELHKLHKKVSEIPQEISPLKALKLRITKPCQVLEYPHIVNQLSESEKEDLSKYLFGCGI